MLRKLIAEFIKRFGRKPEGMEMIRLRQKASERSADIIEFPKDRITPFYKPRPEETLSKAYDKFYDKTGRMKDRGADIMQKGLAGLEKKTLLKDSPEAIAKIKAENKAAAERLRNKTDPEVSGIDSLLKSDFEVISGTSKKGKEIAEKLGITAKPGFPIKESGKADLKLVKTQKRERPSIRLMKNFERELTDIDLAQEGYNLQEIDILQKARNVMKKEGQNPDDALQWVKSEMADAEGVDIEDFMPDFDWGDFPGKRDFAEGGIAPLVGEPTYAANFYDDRTPYQGGGLAGGPPISSGNMNQAPNQIQSMSQGPGALIQPLQQPQPWMTGPQQQAMANAPPEGIAGIAGMAGAQMASNPGPRTPMKEGGTSRRGFLKMMGGLAALPFIGKYLKGAKVAAPAVEKAVEAIKRTADGVPMYWNNLIEVIKAKGVKKIIDSDYSKFPDTQYTYKGVDVIEDATGDVTRVKKNIQWGDDNRMVNPEIEMSVTKGKTQVTDEGLGTQKSFREADEFEEVSVTPDMDGKMKDAEFYVDDSDHLQFEEIANELDMIRTKKASGGLASMLGE